MFRLTVMPVEKGIMVSADRQVLAAVVGNLLVLIEIEDECSVLPSAAGVQKRMMVYARNLSDKGCVFTVDLPRLPIAAVEGVPC